MGSGQQATLTRASGRPCAKAQGYQPEPALVTFDVHSALVRSLVPWRQERLKTLHIQPEQKPLRYLELFTGTGRSKGVDGLAFQALNILNHLGVSYHAYLHSSYRNDQLRSDARNLCPLSMSPRQQLWVYHLWQRHVQHYYNNADAYTLLVVNPPSSSGYMDAKYGAVLHLLAWLYKFMENGANVLACVPCRSGSDDIIVSKLCQMPAVLHRHSAVLETDAKGGKHYICAVAPPQCIEAAVKAHEAVTNGTGRRSVRIYERP